MAFSSSPQPCAKNGVVYPAPLRGQTWIAKDSGEVVHLEIALMHPILPINIRFWSLSINYGPVWLPQSIDVNMEPNSPPAR